MVVEMTTCAQCVFIFKFKFLERENVDEKIFKKAFKIDTFALLNPMKSAFCRVGK